MAKVDAVLKALGGIWAQWAHLPDVGVWPQKGNMEKGDENIWLLPFFSPKLPF